MPFDSNGTFNRLRNWQSDAAANIKIRADYHDSEDDNFAQGLSTCITKDGRTQPIAHIPMNQKRLTNMGEPVSPTDAATKNYVDAIKAFTTGIVISGADNNGMVSFTATTGNNGLSWTGADLSWIARKAGYPSTLTGINNRLALNDRADGSGTDVFFVSEGGLIYQPNLHLDGNVYIDGSNWRVVNAGWPTLFTGSAADGAFRWYSAAATTAAGQVVTLTNPMTLDKDGNLSITGQLSIAKAFYSTTTIQSNGGRIISYDGAASAQPSVTVYSGNRGSAMGMFLDTSNRLAFGSMDGNGVPQNNLMYMDNGGGLTLYTGGLALPSGNGAITAYGQITSSGSNVSAHGNLYALDQTAMIAAGGSGRIMQFYPQWYFDWNSSSGELTWRCQSGHWHAFKTDGAWWISGATGAKSVAGQWASWSDARIKTVLGDYATGLDAILKLKVRRFRFREGDDTGVHVGFVAQEIETVMPETVTRLEGEIAGETVEDKRMLDPTNVMYALVNAVRELSAKLDAANARIAALEAA